MAFKMWRERKDAHASRTGKDACPTTERMSRRNR
jgi:hypothetical protein